MFISKLEIAISKLEIVISKFAITYFTSCRNFFIL